MKVFHLCSVLLAIAGLLAPTVAIRAKNGEQPSRPTTVLYNRVLNDRTSCPELVLGKTPASYEADGLRITGKGDIVRLDRYYSLARRAIRYHVKFSPDARAVFRSDKGDFVAEVDLPRGTIAIKTQPVTEKKVGFLNPGHEYIVEIGRDYQTSSVRITDLFTGESDSIGATNDGQGGYGTGVVRSGFPVGRQYDYYCFGLEEGSELLVRQVCVVSPVCDLTLLLYGDSITEPEGYFPTEDFPGSWVQLILRNVKGRAMSSGRGGTTINELLERIKNELPYIKAKYVMVTIGTNGGNTEENLGELVEYILAQGSVPILNNIPANESGTQIPVNAMIEKVREKYGIGGCRFDLVTSTAHDGLQVDPSAMWLEDYGEGRIFLHHPNLKGAAMMYARTLLDVPEIYE